MNIHLQETTMDETLQHFPTIRSGSFATVGGRPYMEDAHLCIDDLSKHMAAAATVPLPIALYGVKPNITSCYNMAVISVHH